MDFGFAFGCGLSQVWVWVEDGDGDGDWDGSGNGGTGTGREMGMGLHRDFSSSIGPSPLAGRLPSSGPIAEGRLWERSYSGDGRRPILSAGTAAANRLPSASASQAVIATDAMRRAGVRSSAGGVPSAVPATLQLQHCRSDTLRLKVSGDVGLVISGISSLLAGGSTDSVSGPQVTNSSVFTTGGGTMSPRVGNSFLSKVSGWFTTQAGARTRWVVSLGVTEGWSLAVGDTHVDLGYEQGNLPQAGLGLVHRMMVGQADSLMLV